jgi:hypothetical protein
MERETGESEIIRPSQEGGVHVCWSRDPEPARRNEKEGEKDRREMVKWRAGSALNVDIGRKGRGWVDYRGWCCGGDCVVRTGGFVVVGARPGRK